MIYHFKQHVLYEKGEYEMINVDKIESYKIIQKENFPELFDEICEILKRIYVEERPKDSNQFFISNYEELVKQAEFIKVYNRMVRLYPKLDTKNYKETERMYLKALIDLYDIGLTHNIDASKIKMCTRITYGKTVNLIYSIEFHRYVANSSGVYAGIAEPQFGPTVALNMVNPETSIREDFKHPEWCSITVKKLVNGIVCDFTCKRFFSEVYSQDKIRNLVLKAPHEMLAKACEMHAIKKAFNLNIEEPDFESNCFSDVEFSDKKSNVPQSIEDLKSEIGERIELVKDAEFLKKKLIESKLYTEETFMQTLIGSYGVDKLSLLDDKCLKELIKSLGVKIEASETLV